MKKNLLVMGLMTMGLCVSFTSCGDDDDAPSAQTETNGSTDGGSTAYNSAWGNYAVNVARLLANDSQALYDQWTTGGFANEFKNHTTSAYPSAEACVEEILEGCKDIANEVGTAKIGEPYDLFLAGQTNQALYAVESWYSWHSRDDYKNNILSIANVFTGLRLTAAPSRFNTASASSNSLLSMGMANDNLRQATTQTWNAICDAWNAIDAIPQPFRNNIGSAETVEAMDACEFLYDCLNNLQSLIDANLSTDQCQAIVNQFVDVVALPTYADLVAKNNALRAKVEALNSNPSNDTFAEAAAAWIEARQPWETSEAFLFGPVAELGLDPNMDSWPLDVDGIKNLLNSQNWAEMQWSGDYDEESEAIEAAQSVRGYHTLEYLLFLDGVPRTVDTAK